MSWYDPDKEDNTIYNVVVNHEEQYSIWPAHRDNPLGWRNAGKTGPKPDCLAYIKEVWTDMRPLSLRKQMEEMERNPAPSLSEPEAGIFDEPSLVDRLCEGEHPVTAGLRSNNTAEAFKEALGRNYVHVRFTGTRGGTELGFKLDRPACDFSEANFEHATGRVRIEGPLTLDYVPVRCIAEIDLETLQGSGRLVKVSEIQK